jgi:phosphoadenosine phosphosulfate reductase
VASVRSDDVTAPASAVGATSVLPSEPLGEAPADEAAAPAEVPDGLLEEIDSVLAELGEKDAAGIVAWAVARYGDKLIIASSFQDAVLVDLAVRADPRSEIVFLDTGFHFPETLEYVETIRARYDLNLTVLKPGPEAAPWPCGSTRCCETRKVMPLERLIAERGAQAWATGLKRVDSATRANAPVMAWDSARHVLKLNPLAAWSDEEIDAYNLEHGIPTHPLMSQGYTSIGCAPTTKPVTDGAHPRAGRWADSEKTECGLHL